MEIVILPDTEAIGSLAADAIGNLLQRKPDAVLGLATGSSPLAIYDELTARCADGAVSFAQASGFTLDEYVGLPADHPESYRNVIDKEFVSRVDFAPGAVHGPDGLADDIPAACAAYEAAIAAAGGVDLQILGIGTDGHIGFNEPGSSLASRTRIKTLTRQTRIDNARFFGGDLDAVPTHCLTQGLATIMSARHVVLVATGVRARPRRCTTWSRARSARCGRPASCSITRTPRCCWTTRPRAGCSWPTTTGRPTGPSRPGRASELRVPQPTTADPRMPAC